MPLLKDDIFTIDDIYALPAGQRAELIDGIIYDMALPYFIHQKLITKLSQKISNYIDSQKGTFPCCGLSPNEYNLKQNIPKFSHCISQ